MKDRPILFSAPMIRALLAGTKTQTRRIMKPQPTWIESKYTGGHWMIEGHEGRGENRRCVLSTSFDPVEYARTEHGAWFAGSGCPYGQPGDLLWVRETCRAHELTDAEVEAMEPPLGKRDRLYGLDGVVFAADNKFAPIQDTPEAADAWVDLYHYRGTRGATVPPIHMPRWASRLTLRITEVRVQRLKDISEEDAIAEGAEWHDGRGIGHSGWRHDRNDGYVWDAARTSYFHLWNRINGEGSVGRNEWCWCLTFEVIKQNVDAVMALRAA